jgi:hypothetical protein
VLSEWVASGNAFTDCFCWREAGRRQPTSAGGPLEDDLQVLVCYDRGTAWISRLR